MNTPETKNPCGLRERKRAATRFAIQKAAVELSQEHGYSNVTIEMICDAASVSQRTFFNYFGTKDGVFLGPTPPMPSAELIDAFVSQPRSSLLIDFLELLASSRVHVPSHAFLKARYQVIQAEPHLRAMEMMQIAEVEEPLVEILLARLRKDGRSAGSDEALLDEARMILDLTSGVMRFIWKNFANPDETASLRDQLRRAVDVLGRLERSDTR